MWVCYWETNFGYQSLFLEISFEKRGRLIIRVLLYLGQYGNFRGIHQLVCCCCLYQDVIKKEEGRHWRSHLSGCLICSQQVAVAKEYNIKRHYDIQSLGLLLDNFILALTFCDSFRPTWPGLLLIGLIMHWHVFMCKPSINMIKVIYSLHLCYL